MIVSVTITDSRESQIGDAIRSVVGHVDRVLLVDTGIKDGTEAVAREVAQEKLRIARHAWVDYSTARNAGFRFAEELGATWIVIVDSDERLSIGENLRADLAKIQEDVVLMESSSGFYSKQKVIRAGRGAHFTGPTHELLNAASWTTLKGATFSELGKSKEQLARKYARDVELLTEYIKTNPTVPRWWFYLGISQEGLGDLKQAANSFSRCVLLGKFGYEPAWAAYKHAEMLYLMGQFEGAIYAAARGLAADATYAECAWMAGLAAYRLGRNEQAIAWARLSEAVGRFKGCGVENGCGREYGFKHLPKLYELPYDILRYALPEGEKRKQAERDFAQAKLARLGVGSQEELDCVSVRLRTLPPRRDEARSMLRPSPLQAMLPSVRSTKIQFEPPNGYRPMNPSVCRHNGELWCVVRSVNYAITGRDYSVDDTDGIVRTENYLGRLLPSGEFVEPKLMRDLDPSPRQESRIVGYEDIRLVSVEGPEGPELAASCTVCDRDASRRMIAKLDLDRDGNVTRAHVQEGMQQHEKNWMPLVIDGELGWIYSLDPTRVLPGPVRPCPLRLDHLRGGAAISFKDGYLCVTHEAIETNEKRIYLHRFVRLDGQFNVTAVSPAWIFAHHGIEFCAGLVLDGDELVVPYGIDDREAWVMRVRVSDVEAMSWIEP